MKRNLYIQHLLPPTLLHLMIIALCYVTYVLMAEGTPIGIASILLYLLGGLISWTLLEYVLHRFVFHERHLPKGLEKWHKHLVHHEVPESPKEIIAPVQNSAFIALGVFLLIWGLSRNLILALLWFPGMVLGYLAYEWIHFTIHHYPAKNPRLKAYFAYHFHHHFKNPKRHFGVTSPLWDLLFRTR